MPLKRPNLGGSPPTSCSQKDAQINFGRNSARVIQRTSTLCCCHAISKTPTAVKLALLVNNENGDFREMQYPENWEISGNSQTSQKRQ